MEKDTKNWIIIILFFFVILLAGAFLIKPATTGYAVFQEMSKSNMSLGDYEEGITNVKGKLSSLNNNLSNCRNLNERYLEDVKNISKRFAVCEEDLDRCTKEKNNKEKEIEEEYQELIQNMANKICCKKKVDDPSIDSYSISGDNIVCSESGEEKINCGF